MNSLSPGSVLNNQPKLLQSRIKKLIPMNRLAKKNVSRIADLIKRKSIDYDHKAKSTDFKFSKEFKLKTLSMEHMPLFLQQNAKKYSEWFD